MTKVCVIAGTNNRDTKRGLSSRSYEDSKVDVDDEMMMRRRDEEEA